MKRIAGILIIGAVSVSFTSAALAPESIAAQTQVEARAERADAVAQPIELHTRTFKVDYEAFLTALTGEAVGIPDYTQPIRQVDSAEVRKARYEQSRLAIRGFMLGAGLDLTPPKALFVNDRTGRFMIRATVQELEAVERALKRLNVLLQKND